jgi:hypothetical protein
MSGMETDTRDFLKKIVQSIFLGLLWLGLNMTMGIYNGLLFFEDRITAGNIFYYLFFLASLLALIRYYYVTWKKKFPHG